MAKKPASNLIAFPFVYKNGAEIFITEGVLHDNLGLYAQGSWMRLPVGYRHQVSSMSGCTYYLKTGHVKI